MKSINLKERVNLALNKSIESSNICVDSNITRGIIDRNNIKNKWTSKYDEETPWVSIDLGKITKFNEVIIEWERRNVTSYEIQGSNDNKSWTVIKELGKPQELREAVNFKEQEYRYLKLQIKTYAEEGAFGEIPWLNVGIYEVEIYSDKVVDNSVKNIKDDVNLAKPIVEVGQVGKDKDNVIKLKERASSKKTTKSATKRRNQKKDHLGDESPPKVEEEIYF